jgi:hypothetical protein
LQYVKYRYSIKHTNLDNHAELYQWKPVQHERVGLNRKDIQLIDHLQQVSCSIHCVMCYQHDCLTDSESQQKYLYITFLMYLKIENTWSVLYLIQWVSSMSQDFKDLKLVAEGKEGEPLTWMPPTHDGSAQDTGCMQYPGTPPLRPPSCESPADDFTNVGLTAHFSERSKSESIMWPSSRTSTFSGFRSR